jgi:pantoate--beta-alanine ligase
VVTKLLNIVQPDAAFFGRKDAQQGILIQQLVRDLSLPVEIVLCPTVREADGLAVSSRNAYLNSEERQAALVLHRSLGRAREMLVAGERSAERLVAGVRGLLEAEPRVRVDYVAVVDAATLEPAERLQGRIVLALAAWVGKARLIDNLMAEDTGNGWRIEL